MRAVDTNVLVRLIVRDDLRQTQVAEGFVADGAWVSHLVLAETMWVFRAQYAAGPQQIATAVALLLNQQQVVFEDEEVVEAALQLYRARPSLGFSDCLVLEIARKAGHLPLGTFDRALSRLEGATRL